VSTNSMMERSLEDVKETNRQDGADLVQHPERAPRNIQRLDARSRRNREVVAANLIRVAGAVAAQEWVV